MRVTFLAIASGFALSISATAFAAETQPTVTAQPAVATSGSEKMVCHHLIHEGIMTNQVRCLSQRGWDRVRLDTQQTLSDFQRHSYVTPVH